MKPGSLIFSIVVFFSLAVAPSASAHRVNVFAWVDGDTVYVESKFPSGKKVKAGKVLVLDSRGNELLTGLTDDQGQFSFKVPKRTDLKIVVAAGEGHQAEWTVRAADIEKLPLNVASEAGAANSEQSGGTRSDTETSADTGTRVSDTGIKREELEAIIESVLDKKLKPIQRKLADMQQEGPGVKDIFAGIGYILGLVGLAAYVHSRKNKG